jgi:hypothetical protein
MREIRPSGSEGGVRFKPSFLPLSSPTWPAGAGLFRARVSKRSDEFGPQGVAGAEVVAEAE